MGSNWKTARLLDQYEIRSGLSKPAKDFGTGYPFLTFKDVFYNYFTPEVLGDLVESTDKERDGCSVKRGDVFLTRTSETMNELGMSCVALKDYEGATFNGFCKRLRPNEQCELVPEYVGYYLRSPKFRQAMLAFSTMSTRASLNNEMIGRLEISYPPKEAQRHIAHVLKTLDNKITLNRQINQTLEQMAQTLFKSWFVDFDPVIDNALDAGNPIPDELQHRAEARKAVRESTGFKPLPDDVRQLFPDAFEESELGWVPKGWRTKPINSFFNLLNGFPFKSKDYVTDGEFGIVTIKNVQGGHFVESCSNSLSSIPEKMKSHCVLEQGDVLMSLTGNVGRVCSVSRGKYLLNQRVVKITSKESLPTSFSYFFFRDKGIFERILQIAKGTAQQNLSPVETGKLVISLPQVTQLTQAAKHFDSFYQKMSMMNAEIQTLETLRDTLLPKLISGELRLDDVEVAVEQETVSA